MTADDYTIGMCHACSEPIDSREGTRVDPEGNRYHPDCRTATPAKPAPAARKAPRARRGGGVKY